MQMVAEKRHRDAVLDVREFISKPIPERKVYLKPWLAEQSITMISAPRGTGKTWLGLSLTYSLTTREPLGPWTVENSGHVLYLDAESSQYDIQSRIKKIVRRFNMEKAFSIYSTALAHEIGLPSPSLMSEDWRQGMREYLLSEGYEIIILDNLASLTPGIDENIKRDWDPVNQWLLSLRFAGVSSILMHHTNKFGGQRGTSAREDNIDNSIMLTPPPRRDEGDGAKFTVQFSKCRGLYGSEIEPIVLHLTQDDDGRLIWTWSEVRVEAKKKILRMLDDGYAQKDIAEEVGVTGAYVSKVKKEAIEEGYLTKQKQLTHTGFCYLNEGEI
jgi:putative DNA primase/helicase